MSEPRLKLMCPGKDQLHGLGPVGCPGPACSFTDESVSGSPYIGEFEHMSKEEQ